MWPARRRGRYLNNTQQTQQMSIHALRDIRTHYPSNQTAADLRVWEQGNKDRLGSM